MEEVGNQEGGGCSDNIGGFSSEAPMCIKLVDVLKSQDALDPDEPIELEIVNVAPTEEEEAGDAGDVPEFKVEVHLAEEVNDCEREGGRRDFVEVAIDRSKILEPDTDGNFPTEEEEAGPSYRQPEPSSNGGQGGSTVRRVGGPNASKPQRNSVDGGGEEGWRKVSGQGFECSVCGLIVVKKSDMNRHLKEEHGIAYVYTERGTKIRVVRVPEEDVSASSASKQVDEWLDRTVFKTQSAKQHVPVLAPAKEAMRMKDEETSEESQKDEEETDWNTFGLGFVLALETKAFKVAKERKESCFAAFLPYSSKYAYALKIKDIEDGKQLLEPAGKGDVLEAHMVNFKTGFKGTEGGQVPIVAFIRQVKDRQTGTMNVFVEPPSHIENLVIKVMSFERFRRYTYEDQEEVPENLKDKELRRQMNDQRRISNAISPSQLPVPTVSPISSSLPLKKRQIPISILNTPTQPERHDEPLHDPSGSLMTFGDSLLTFGEDENPFASHFSTVDLSALANCVNIN